MKPDRTRLDEIATPYFPSQETDLDASSKPHAETASSGPERIFSGDGSRHMWNSINNLDALSTQDDVREVLYCIGCRLQVFEDRVMQTLDTSQRAALQTASSPAETRAAVVGYVRVPQAAIDWLMGEGESFEPTEAHGVGRYWWRSEFSKRAGLVAKPDGEG